MRREKRRGEKAIPPPPQPLHPNPKLGWSYGFDYKLLPLLTGEPFVLCGSAELTSSLRPHCHTAATPSLPLPPPASLFVWASGKTDIHNFINGCFPLSVSSSCWSNVCTNKKGKKKIDASSLWTGLCLDATSWIKIPVLVLTSQHCWV